MKFQVGDVVEITYNKTIGTITEFTDIGEIIVSEVANRQENGFFINIQIHRVWSVNYIRKLTKLELALK